MHRIVLLGFFCGLIYSLTIACSQYDALYTVGQQIIPIICTCDVSCELIMYPSIPEGLTFSNNQLSGTPTHPQQITESNIGEHIRSVAQAVVISIGIIGHPSYFSYGFIYNILYIDSTIYPISPRSDTVFTHYWIHPSLFNGLSFSNTTGTITGIPFDLFERTHFYVTAENDFGSLTTEFDLQVVDSQLMNVPGILSCYYDDISVCNQITKQWFLTHDAVFCYRVPSINFDDEYSSAHGSHAWPGLDERFLDFYSASFTGYIIISTPGDYTFTIEVDDGASLYIDDRPIPIINNFYCSVVRVKSGTAYLTSGKHLIYVPYFDVNLSNKLVIYYTSSETNGEKIYLSEANMRIGGHGPAFLSYPEINGIVNSYIITTKPSFNYGGSGSFTVTPSLPIGLSIDSNGFISGKVKNPVSGQYIVTFENSLGAMNAILNIHILSSLLPGIHSIYYKYLDPYDVCQMEEKNAFQIEKRIDRIDEQLYFPQSTYVHAWDGLYEDMGDHIYVEFQGYLYFNTIGLYHIAVNSDDGFKFYFDNQLLFEDYTCRGNYRNSHTIQISEIGYHSFFIKYFEDYNGHSFEFEWKVPLSLYFENIPSSFLFHSPVYQFTYTYMDACYYVNKRITNNSPLWFNVTSLSNYSITPLLPDGLILSTRTGVISGTPLSSSLKTHYKITNGLYTVIISIIIFNVNPPRNFYYEYNNIALIDTLIISLSETIVLLPHYINTITNYSITPSLPSGLSLNIRTGAIEGKIAKVLLEDVLYTIQGCNVAGCITTTVILRTESCSDSYYYYTKILEGLGTINIEYDGQIESQYIRKTVGSYIHCFNHVTANYHFSCNTPPCSFIFYRDDQLYYFSQYELASTFSTIITKTISSPSFIVIESLYTIHARENVIIQPFDIQSPYSQIKFTPELPKSVIYEYERNQLRGFWTTLGTYTYSVQIENPMGRSSIQLLVFSVLSCGNTKTLLQFEMQCELHHTEESAVISQNNINLVTLSYSEDYETLNYNICVSYNDVVIELFDTYNNGWSLTSYIAVYEENGALFGKWTMPSINTGEHYIQTISLDYIIKKETNWKYFTYQVDISWTTTDFEDSKWQIGTFNNYQNIFSSTIYYRMIFSIDNPWKYALLELSIYYKDGIVVFMNSEEIYRNHISSETVSYNSYATDSYDNYQYHRISIPSYSLVVGNNVLAIEIHQISDIFSNAFNFDCFGKLFVDDCVNRLNSFTIRSSDFYNMPYERAYEAVDQNLDTKWYENGLPAFIEIELNYDRHDWINKIQLFSGDDHSERDPKHFTFKGSNDHGITWDLLLDIDEKNIWSARKSMREWWITNTLYTYNLFRLDILTVESGSYTQLADIRLFTCHLMYCLQEGDWPTTASGEISTLNCPIGYVGEQTRMCSNVVSKPTWLAVDLSLCLSLSPPIDMAYIDMILLFSGVTVEGIQNSGYKTIQSGLSSILSISTDTILVYLCKDMSTLLTVSSRCYIRITTNKENADSIYTTLFISLTSLETYLISSSKDIFPDNTEISYIKSPIVTKSTLMSMSLIITIIILVILSLISIFFIVFSILSRRKRNGTKKKTLHVVVGHKRILKTI